MARLPKLPLRLDGATLDLRHQPPGVGEGGRELYRRCGYSDAAIDGLAAEGIIDIS